MKTEFLTWYTAMLDSLPHSRGCFDIPALQEAGHRRSEAIENPNTTRFWSVLAAVPDCRPSVMVLDQAMVRIGAATDLTPGLDMRALLQGLMPWRKGPFSIFGVDIDTEWRSHMKWDRLAPALPPLYGKRILDIGCGSGYYMCRLAAAQPSMILGADPSDLFLAQWILLSRYLFPSSGLSQKALPVTGFFPFGYETILGKVHFMDVVLAMGVLYHQRSPLHFLLDLKSFLKPGGCLFLETLIIDSPEDVALFPRDRYAQMRNVYFLPSLSCLKNLCMRSGWRWDAVIDVSLTTVQEQRRTDWIKTDSLMDFLDPKDPTKTIEGYPAPLRALVRLSLPES
jgi:tRNA (mo5U34)-methyltransferase